MKPGGVQYICDDVILISLKTVCAYLQTEDQKPVIGKTFTLPVITKFIADLFQNNKHLTSFNK